MQKCSKFYFALQEEPYLKLKSPSQRQSLSGNDLYEGYIKDLADILFANLNAKCTNIEIKICAQKL